MEYHEDIERNHCGHSDLRPEMERRGLPDRRHQDSTGWCYAMVAADLVSFETHQNISPADIAKHYINANPISFQYDELPLPIQQLNPLGGGFIKNAIELTMKDGFCQEAEFPSEDYSFSIIRNSTLAREDLMRNYAESQGVKFSPGDKINLPLVCLELAAVSNIFELPNIDVLVNMIKQNDFRRILETLSQSRCTYRFPLRGNKRPHQIERPSEKYESNSNDSFFNTIESLISRGKPVGVGIDNSIFHNPQDSLLTAPEPNHAVQIVGRRFNADKRRCEYLMRNTQEGCQTFNEDYECENNHTWIPREIVQMGTVNAVFVSE